MPKKKDEEVEAKGDVKYIVVNLAEEMEQRLAKGEQVTLSVVMVVTNLAEAEKALEIPNRPIGNRVAVLEIKKRYSLSPVMRVGEI